MKVEIEIMKTKETGTCALNKTKWKFPGACMDVVSKLVREKNSIWSTEYWKIGTKLASRFETSEKHPEHWWSIKMTSIMVHNLKVILWYSLFFNSITNCFKHIFKFRVIISVVYDEWYHAKVSTFTFDTFWFLISYCYFATCKVGIVTHVCVVPCETWCMNNLTQQ